MIVFTFRFNIRLGESELFQSMLCRSVSGSNRTV
jgi:hypothetical protein